tara:strand:+ start:457 stop:1233 length:777 start_codon:yes stop_codon:yes gene_type:complete
MSEKINIAIVQTSIKWEDTQGNLSNYEQIINSMNPGVDIIFFPEMFNTGFSMNVKKISETMDGETVSWLQKAALRKNVSITATLAIEENKNFYNRLVWIFPNGKIIFYDKRHTFTLAGESKVYTRGKAKKIIAYKGWKFLPQVCYDLRFPVWSRNDSDYDILFYLANWPKPRISHWKNLLVSRAIENMSYCIGVNIIGSDPENKYNGYSCIINPNGEHCIDMTEDETVIYYQLNKSKINEIRHSLNFLDDKDDFSLKF